MLILLKISRKSDTEGHEESDAEKVTEKVKIKNKNDDAAQIMRRSVEFHELYPLPCFSTFFGPNFGVFGYLSALLPPPPCFSTFWKQGKIKRYQFH